MDTSKDETPDEIERWEDQTRTIVAREDGSLFDAPIITDDDGHRFVVIDHDDDTVMIPWDDLANDTTTTSAPVADVDVDTPDDTPAPADKTDQPRTDISTWARSRVGTVLRHVGNHIMWSPWYVLYGAVTTARGIGRWVTGAADAEVRADEIKAARSSADRATLRRIHANKVILRSIVVAVPVGITWGWIELGRWGIVPAIITSAAYVILHVTGYRRLTDRPEAQAAARQVTAKGKRPALSRPFVTEALAIAGFGEISLPNGGSQGPMIMSATPIKGGERMVIDLPPGVPVSRLVKKHEELAGALGRPAECVSIEPRPEVSPLRFELFIAHQLLKDRKATAWEWSKVKARSLFDPVPVGIDDKGNTVTTPMFQVHGMIGGGTGMGKSFTARLLLLAAACDPTAKILIHNLKGGPDYKGFAPVAHSLRAGSSRSDLVALADDLAWVQAEIGRRGRLLESLPASEVPEGKITPQIARDHDMGIIVVLIDEAQRAFASAMGETIEDRVEDAVRTGRAVGVIVWVVTQGTKEGAIRSGILDQLGHRIGHGVTNISDANLILGSDAHGRGYRAVDIETSGVAYVGTAGGRMVRTMMAKVDLPDVERIVVDAAKIRREQGTLSGMAAGVIAPDTHDGGTRSFLADVLDVWPTDNGMPAPNAWSSSLADLLTVSDADEYPAASTQGADVSRRLAECGVKVSTQRIGGTSARGVRHADVLSARGTE